MTSPTLHILFLVTVGIGVLLCAEGLVRLLLWTAGRDERQFFPPPVRRLWRAVRSAAFAVMCATAIGAVLVRALLS